MNIPRENADTAQTIAGVDVEKLGEVAFEVATDAARHVRRRRPELFGRTGTAPGTGNDVVPSAVSTKSTPTDPVTLADTESEELIRGLLKRLRPDDAVLGEEEGGTVEVPSGVRWVIDPIDGTVNFLYGLDNYAVSIGVAVNGELAAGAVQDVPQLLAARGAVDPEVGAGSEVGEDIEGCLTARGP